jgi:predicted secreted protein
MILPKRLGLRCYGKPGVRAPRLEGGLVANKSLVMLEGRVVRAGAGALVPVLEELADASDGRVTLMKVRVDENPAPAPGDDIRSIPTILFVKEGTVVDGVGFRTDIDAGE